MPKMNKSEDEWRHELTPEQFRILREKGTERAFTGEYNAEKRKGVYRCAGCGTQLFDATSNADHRNSKRVAHCYVPRCVTKIHD